MNVNRESGHGTTDIFQFENVFLAFNEMGWNDKR